MNLQNSVYKISKIPRGYSIIVNNEFKNNVTKERRGSSLNVKKLEDIFTRLHFTKKIGIDLKSNELLEFLKEISQDSQLEHHDAFIMVLMSHGKSKLFECSDGNYLQFNEITNIFSDERCPQLVNKPKIIIFNCCRIHDPSISKDL